MGIYQGRYSFNISYSYYTGVADQLQTNYAADLRHILKVVFECYCSDADEHSSCCKQIEQEQTFEDDEEKEEDEEAQREQEDEDEEDEILTACACEGS